MANTYKFTAYNIVFGNGKTMALLWNTSATSIVSVRRVVILNNQLSSVTGVLAELRLRRVTAVTTVGTSLTIDKTLTTIPNLTNVNAYTGSTGVTSTDVIERIFWSTDETTPTEYNIDSFHTHFSYNTIFEGGYGSSNIEPIVLRQNQGLELNCLTNTVVGNMDIYFEFTVV